ncbi:DegT/DnrJ/EryC1/StrS aminotransferase family protein [Paraburkholderia sp.]|uniref:DegT/DnrJ/EryC1/StrS family aminotransferase n=1 Tax=Paraburkholderia sp. TaxID=1926495 RepID=UPI0025E5B5F7|nr:DegT/DnrJ/EryC1/StrS family aminotransferase [Paraburkholderia sp.]
MSDITPIPLFSAVAANAGLDLITPLKRVLQRHWYVLGEEVSQFEREFSAYLGVSHCVTVANGTDALELALRAAGVKAGDVVATVANAGFYSSTAIHAIGASPLYIDVEERTLTLSPSAFEKALEHKPTAVIVTHLYGQLADVTAITGMARAAGVTVIEDCAQSHGAQRNGKQAGSFGDVACFSFYPTKNLGAVGDGGAIATNNEAIATAVRTLRQYGWSAKYHVGSAGGRNSRLDEMQAAILREKLPNLDRWNAERRSIAIRYNEAFADLPLRCPLSTDSDYVAHLYVIRLEKRDALRGHLHRLNISTDVHYPVADHQQSAYRTVSSPSLPVTEAACREIVTLPCFPGLTSQEVEKIIAAVREYFLE